MIDPRQDNWRAGNWSGAFPPAAFSPSAQNTVRANLPAFPPLWLNELQADNLTGLTNLAGQHSPWLEIYNPTTNVVSLGGLYLANDYANLAAWAFPSNAVINPGEFKVVFADSQTNLSTLAELHAGFTLASGTGSLALSRIYNGTPQVLDYIDYANLGFNHSFGSYPDGQSFVRQEFAAATPGGANIDSTAPSFVAYATPGAVYVQDFDSLPNPGAASANAANPVTIDGITYSLANPFDFAAPAVGSGSTGGLELARMAGWYGLGELITKFGATDGDQTTGGQISFGAAGSSNRALGLLATSSTGNTAFGVKLINATGQTLNYLNLQFTGEVWRQSNLPKTLAVSYFIDPTASSPFSGSFTSLLPSLNVSFPTVAADTGGVAVDGTAAINQTNLSLVNQPITSWPPGAALWLAWTMADPAGKAQGLAIDTLSFSATAQATLTPVPLDLKLSANKFTISWQGLSGQRYQLDYKADLSAQSWTPLNGPVSGTGIPISLIITNANSASGFYRLSIVP